MKYALLFVAVYAALFVHRSLTHNISVPRPRESIRADLAREKEGRGPLSQAFEIIAHEARVSKKSVPVIHPNDPLGAGDFSFLITAEDTRETFLEKLRGYSESSEATSEAVQVDVLRYALTQPETQNAYLIGIATQLLENPENFGLSAGSQGAREVTSLAAELLSRQIPDLAELESIAQPLKLLHPQDTGVSEALEKILVARRAQGTD
ncbi:MAG: hypothetical protein ABIR96_00190 [Bdellovibrionota bacterium]